MVQEKTEILLTNDDGIHSEGILSLYQELKKIGNVTIVAPLEEMSGTGHAITFTSPLKMTKIERSPDFVGFGINGTPTDCVKIAVHSLLKKRPKIIVSGINHGPNFANLLFYSGTVSAALEGAILGIPSIAVSLSNHNQETHFDFAAHFARKVSALVLKKGLPKNTCLNINIPNLPKKKIKGINFTKQGPHCFREYFSEKKDSKNQISYWMGMETKKEQDHKENIDSVAISNNEISITPIMCDLTNHAFLEQLKTWKL